MYTEQSIKDRVKAELALLDEQPVEINGVRLKPSQCFHVGTNPFHVLFNTNCPDDLKCRVQAILSKYMPANEGSTS
jgi:hypothetical protein